MNVHRENLVEELRQLASARQERSQALQAIADLLKNSGGYRWAGLYDVDHAAEVVRIIVWSGPGAPEFPTFPFAKGLTSSVIASGKTVNVGNVDADPRYLTAFGTTKSEMIIPVFDGTGKVVVGTIDLESETPHAFSAEGRKAPGKLLRRDPFPVVASTG